MTMTITPRRSHDDVGRAEQPPTTGPERPDQPAGSTPLAAAPDAGRSCGGRATAPASSSGGLRRPARAGLHVDARASRARWRRCHLPAGLRGARRAGPRLPVDVAGVVDAHAPRRRAGVASPARPAGAGAAGWPTSRSCSSPPAPVTGWTPTVRPPRSTAATESRRARCPPAVRPPATCLSPASAGRTVPTARRSSTPRSRASAEGVSIERTWDTMGMRATGSETVVFDDVFVPDAAVALVRPCGQWHPVWGTVARLGVAADHGGLRRRRRVRRGAGDRTREFQGRAARGRTARRHRC